MSRTRATSKGQMKCRISGATDYQWKGAEIFKTHVTKLFVLKNAADMTETKTSVGRSQLGILILLRVYLVRSSIFKLSVLLFDLLSCTVSSLLVHFDRAMCCLMPSLNSGMWTPLLLLHTLETPYRQNHVAFKRTRYRELLILKLSRSNVSDE